MYFAIVEEPSLGSAIAVYLLVASSMVVIAVGIVLQISGIR